MWRFLMKNNELVQKTDLKRKKGKLYYIDLDGDICEGVKLCKGLI